MFLTIFWFFFWVTYYYRVFRHICYNDSVTANHHFVSNYSCSINDHT
ncbi:hypothetical protein C801_02435 [Bacteroides uniformis dnLKV2]|uniref:Uncharacterized protein n=1 Tax=Bacteroides uniformis dnLKV2 TaxID=1235787 RepID=R9HV84_BACUN|nr:hypothetical protein C801_02435 [Bacteroides uniformis dnLKV2]